MLEIDNNLRNFCVDLMIKSNEVVDRMDIGDFEIVYTLVNGEKYRYDAISSNAFHIRPRPKDDDNLTELEWRKEFARKLKRKLYYNGITQHELSQMINISEYTISNYINGKTTANGYAISKIARAIECTTGELTDFGYLL